ncbi:hypothetical protein [Marinicrinis sediminis]|uniref:Uncharacterized protein n=1 Tax=Marinicrinis sediminis TaxID=1652465 RepID=A0ABW5RDX5_9BACL
MRPLFNVGTTELEGIHFAIITFYDSHGWHAGQTVKPIAHAVDLVDVILDIMLVNDVKSVDLETDDEGVFKIFYNILGINCSLIPSADLSHLYRIMTPADPMFHIMQELFLLNRDDTREEQADEPVSKNWLIQFFTWINSKIRKDDKS